MSNNQLPAEVQLPPEIVSEINKGAQSTLARASSDLKYSAGYFDGYSEGATAYATKMHLAEEEHKRLIRVLLEVEEGKRKELIEKAQVLVDALGWFKQFGNELSIKFIDNVLQQWKGKEVEKCETDKVPCKNCGKPTTNNVGSSYYLCDICLQKPGHL